MNESINESLIELNNSFIRKIPEGCNQTIDKIVQNGSEIICYHQQTAEEVIKPMEPILYIITAIISALIGYLILKYLKNRHSKQ